MTSYHVIIIGGSYAGLSAAMSLGRSMRNVLIIDSGKPCNRQTPHSHNLLTHDGETPWEISIVAKEQVMNYSSVVFHEGVADRATCTNGIFEVTTASGDVFHGRKLIMASGINDILPAIKGIDEAWGISAIHCPYCHGYEVKGRKTGILMNGELAFEFSKLVFNLTKDLTLFTNGTSTLTAAQTDKLAEKNIRVVEKEIIELIHHKGMVKEVVFDDESRETIEAMYVRPALAQNSNIPAAFGCAFTESGHLVVDAFQKTTVDGIFACGDNVTMMRSLSSAIAAGTLAGAAVNKELSSEDFAA